MLLKIDNFEVLNRFLEVAAKYGFENGANKITIIRYYNEACRLGGFKLLKDSSYKDVVKFLKELESEIAFWHGSDGYTEIVPNREFEGSLSIDYTQWLEHDYIRETYVVTVHEMEL